MRKNEESQKKIDKNRYGKTKERQEHLRLN